MRVKMLMRVMQMSSPIWQFATTSDQGDSDDDRDGEDDGGNDEEVDDDRDGEGNQVVRFALVRLAGWVGGWGNFCRINDP